ncbi:hypothetical protein DEU56DRAFT_945830 [Suillus clintonianus]|uniref:uncharacterized protein n=1 Tax=Suillus clintonianus TaxID=1904413 RepID=UPI001B8614F8|nr:uncharacterized protein DEU56DRAFT_945830 [Suillus clintonianus]KAG2138013.1 hypothetical protein DEU56DRAFT_945830 [Suillus clintonianus]
MKGADAYPGYFSLNLDNDIKMEATSTRRAGLERFTLPNPNDLPASLAGGTLDIDPENGRITIGDRYGSSFGPGSDHYQAFACDDLLSSGTQKLSEYGIWTGDT